MRTLAMIKWRLLAFAWTMWSADMAWATTDTTFAGLLGTVTGIVSGTGGQLAAALAVGTVLARRQYHRLLVLVV